MLHDVLAGLCVKIKSIFYTKHHHINFSTASLRLLLECVRLEVHVLPEIWRQYCDKCNSRNQGAQDDDDEYYGSDDGVILDSRPSASIFTHTHTPSLSSYIVDVLRS